MQIKRKDLGITKPPERRESTIDVLRRLKAQEGKTHEKRDPFILEKGDDGFPVVKTLPESNIISLLTKIEALERQMKTFVMELGTSDNVIFHGELSNRDAMKILNKSKVFLLTSNYESFG
ncbi:MAG: glycosyltransferase, partial [Candidatus Nanoarchaeia archaeon]